MEKEFPTGDLPSVDEAKALVAQYRKDFEKHIKDEQLEEKRAELKDSQDRRIADLLKEKQALRMAHDFKREAFLAGQRRERDTLRRDYLERRSQILEER